MLARALEDVVTQLCELLDRVTVDRDHDVAFFHPGRTCRAAPLARRLLAVGVRVGDALDLAYARAHVHIWIGNSRGNRHEVQHGKAEYKVDCDASEHHRDALPPRLVAHGMRRLFLGEVLVLGGHARDVAVAADRQGSEPVLGVSAPKRQKRRPKADEVAPHAHSEGAGSHHMPRLVQGDGYPDAEGEGEDAQNVCH